LLIHISIDASGSMSGDKWIETLTLCSIIAYATNGMDGIRTQISFRYSDWNDYTNVIFYDSKLDDIKKIELLAYSQATGSTPEGYCFSALCDNALFKEVSKNTLFINFSDGAPDNQDSVEVTKKMVNYFKRSGVSVLSYFIQSRNDGYGGTDFNTFNYMYGKDSVTVKSSEMVKLAKILNKKFLSLGIS